MGKILRLLNVLLAPIGVRLQRTRESDANGGEGDRYFYKPTSTCQISELANLYRLFLGKKTDGVFVEVGANDGISVSNSSCLADVGWTGILIEPIPQFAQACRNHYRGNDRIQVVEAAVGATESNIEITIAGLLTTTNESLLKGYRSLDWAMAAVRNTTRLTVRQRSLNEILETAGLGGKSIDVLIVDVEGAEAAVFEGFSITRWAPKMIIVELAHTHPDLHVISAGDADLQRLIENAGYAVVYKDSINTVFVPN